MRVLEKAVALVALQLWLGALAGTSVAAVLNVDIEADLGLDVTHVGSDGVFSTGGAYWNGVEVVTGASNLSDETGAATGVDVVWPGGGFGGTNPASTNDLQDSGTYSSFEIRDLTAGVTYDIAVYAGGAVAFDFTDSTGSAFVFCAFGSPSTYVLPGTDDADYCLLTDRMPADLGGGEVGFRLTPIDGLIAGFQIPLAGGAGPSPVPAVPVGWLAGLIGSLFAVGSLHLRRVRADGNH